MDPNQNQTPRSRIDIEDDLNSVKKEIEKRKTEINELEKKSQLLAEEASEFCFLCSKNKVNPKQEPLWIPETWIPDVKIHCDSGQFDVILVCDECVHKVKKGKLEVRIGKKRKVEIEDKSVDLEPFFLQACKSLAFAAKFSPAVRTLDSKGVFSKVKLVNWTCGVCSEVIENVCVLIMFFEGGATDVMYLHEVDCLASVLKKSKHRVLKGFALETKGAYGFFYSILKNPVDLGKHPEDCNKVAEEIMSRYTDE